MQSTITGVHVNSYITAGMCWSFIQLEEARFMPGVEKSCWNFKLFP